MAERLEILRDRIVAAGRDPDEVTVVAVTKGFDPRAVLSAVACGIEDVGENYASELLGKVESLAGLDGESEPHPSPERDPRWHYLGVIQRRTVRALAQHVACWQSLSRVEEARSIALHAPGAAVFVQVQASGAPGRNGVAPNALAELVDVARSLGLEVRGLMVVAPKGPPQAVVDAFSLVGALARRHGLGELSMGMTNDLETALAAGSTTLRVGRFLFGERTQAEAAGSSRA